MKTNMYAACLLLAAMLFFGFTKHHTSVPVAGSIKGPQSEACYPLTGEQLDKLGGPFAAGMVPEPRLQVFFKDFAVKAMEKSQMLQQFSADAEAGAVTRFQCNTGWTYFYSYGNCTANYNRPECGYYVRIRYYKKYRFYACRYEEVTISSTVVCC